MTREEAYNRIDAIIAKHEIDDVYVTITNFMDYDALRIARKTLEQEPCDCISRQAVLACKQTFHDNAGYETEYVDIDDIKALPSIQPKTDVLDKIRAEIHATAEMHEDGDYYLRDEWIDEIINKYKAESEDKE